METKGIDLSDAPNEPETSILVITYEEKVPYDIRQRYTQNNIKRINYGLNLPPNNVFIALLLCNIQIVMKLRSFRL